MLDGAAIVSLRCTGKGASFRRSADRSQKIILVMFAAGSRRRRGQAVYLSMALSTRALLSAFPQTAALERTSPVVGEGAITGLLQRSKCPLFDHLVGAGDNGRGQLDA